MVKWRRAHVFSNRVAHLHMRVAARSRWFVGPRAKLQNKPAEVRVLGEIADMTLDVSGVDLDGLAGAVGSREGNLVEHARHHRLQATSLGTIAPAALLWSLVSSWIQWQKDREYSLRVSGGRENLAIFPASSEPYVRISPHTAQASASMLSIRRFGARPGRHQRWMKTRAVSPVMESRRAMTVVLSC